MMFLIAVIKCLQEATLKETLFGVYGQGANAVPTGRIGKAVRWLVALPVEANAAAYMMSRVIVHRTSGEGVTHNPISPTYIALPLTSRLCQKNFTMSQNSTASWGPTVHMGASNGHFIFRLHQQLMVLSSSTCLIILLLLLLCKCGGMVCVSVSLCL